jgi:outer membrane immunogenic protein
MRRIALALLGIFGIGSFSGASAADLAARPVVKAPPAVVAVYNWTGFYIGAHVGYAHGKKAWFDDDDGSSRESHDVSGVIAGGQLGFNWQTGNWVLGIEGQASWSNADGEHFWQPGTVTFRSDVQWLGTIAGRFGYAFDRVLVYAKGGAAFVHDEHELAEGAIIIDQGDKTRWGWMVGGGIEVAVVGNWSVKGEYNYMDFGKESVAFTPGQFTMQIDQHLHVVKFGINYRFGPSPVVARY